MTDALMTIGHFSAFLAKNKRRSTTLFLAHALDERRFAIVRVLRYALYSLLFFREGVL